MQLGQVLVEAYSLSSVLAGVIKLGQSIMFVTLWKPKGWLLGRHRWLDLACCRKREDVVVKDIYQKKSWKGLGSLGMAEAGLKGIVSELIKGRFFLKPRTWMQCKERGGLPRRREHQLVALFPIAVIRHIEVT